MLFTTPTQWAALGFTLLAGWLFGLATSSGGKKWKRQLEQAEVDHAAARDRDDQELRATHVRIRELERAMAARPAPAPAPAAPAPVATTAPAVASAPTLGPIVMPTAQIDTAGRAPNETADTPEPAPHIRA